MPDAPEAACAAGLLAGAAVSNERPPVGLSFATSRACFASARCNVTTRCMAQIAPAFTKLGTELTIRDNGNDYTATVVRMPFYDPMRLRTHPVG